jgi:hypothetical protein
VRAARERLDVQRLRELPVDPVADPAQPGEIASDAIRHGGTSGARGVQASITLRSHLEIVY